MKRSRCEDDGVNRVLPVMVKCSSEGVNRVFKKTQVTHNKKQNHRQ